MRIALWNASGLLNVGDLVLDQIARVELSRRIPNAEFETFCPWPLRSGVNKLMISAEGEWAGQGRFDAIVVGGGALLMGPPFRHPGLQHFFFGPQPKKFKDRAVKVWNAVCCDGQIADSSDPILCRYVKDATSQVAYLTVRNERTKAFLESWGTSAQINVVPDPAILICGERDTAARLRDDVGWLIAQPVFPQSFIEQMKTLAFEEWPQANKDVVKLSADPDHDYFLSLQRNKIAHLLSSLSQRRFLRIAGLKNMYGDAEFAIACENILPADARRDLTVITDRVDDLVTWMSSVGCVVASRLHHCILSVALGIPVVALDPYYSPQAGTSKLYEFLKACGLSRHYYSLASSEMLRLEDMIERALADEESFIDARYHLRAQSKRHFDGLSAALQRMR